MACPAVDPAELPLHHTPGPKCKIKPGPSNKPSPAGPGPWQNGRHGLRPLGPTFDVILSSLQGKVQKSSETGASWGPTNLLLFLAYLLPVRALPPDVVQPPLPSQPAAAAPPAAAGGTEEGLPTAPVAVPTEILAEERSQETEIGSPSLRRMSRLKLSTRSSATQTQTAKEEAQCMKGATTPTSTICGLEHKMEELEGLLRGAVAVAAPASSAANASSTFAANTTKT
ncbi:hypothetical protein CVT25_004973 [Psilocybe cyanescens]|uniref:Uncharacterized protein n=1 Tax=Psilocybe cyanescens TaxID=93625 RepID=A0A409W406_PSICY|nr:hypothetical protein CVT25_004973 [Psilocybe cyanescens]